MPIVSARPKPRMKRSHFNAMERLARSRWGKQGIGFCPRMAIRIELLSLRFAEHVKGEHSKVMALTLTGFRALEAERNERILDTLVVRRRRRK